MPRHRAPLRPTIAPRLLLLPVLLLALLGGAAFLPGPVAGATVVVGSGADSGGTCPGASCTLRQALATAAAGDTITFAPAVVAVLTEGVDDEEATEFIALLGILVYDATP